MAFTIRFTKQALQSLKDMPRAAEVEVMNAIEAILSNQPNIPTRRIKRLRGIRHPDYRLRVADWRVFYDVIENEVQVMVIDILHDGPAHAWYKELEAQQREQQQQPLPKKPTDENDTP